MCGVMFLPSPHAYMRWTGKTSPLLLHRAVCNSLHLCINNTVGLIIDKHQHMHFFTLKTVLV